MEPWKGQHVLVEAAPEILEAIPDAVILFVGDEVKGRGRERYSEELRIGVQNAGFSGRVFFSGYVEDVDVLMRAASVVVNCSTVPEPFGLTVLEGLWYGTPVVAPALGGPLETVGNPPAALLHTPGNAKDWSTAVVRILRDHSWPANSSGRKNCCKVYSQRLWPEFSAL
jgi:glycosyltransferase involved in cell wall biosynthesis